MLKENEERAERELKKDELIQELKNKIEEELETGNQLITQNSLIQLELASLQ